jgi:hypothetical protein
MGARPSDDAAEDLHLTGPPQPRSCRGWPCASIGSAAWQAAASAWQLRGAASDGAPRPPRCRMQGRRCGWSGAEHDAALSSRPPTLIVAALCCRCCRPKKLWPPRQGVSVRQWGRVRFAGWEACGGPLCCKNGHQKNSLPARGNPTGGAREAMAAAAAGPDGDSSMRAPLTPSLAARRRQSTPAIPRQATPPARASLCPRPSSARRAIAGTPIGSIGPIADRGGAQRLRQLTASPQARARRATWPRTIQRAGRTRWPTTPASPKRCRCRRRGDGRNIARHRAIADGLPRARRAGRGGPAQRPRGAAVPGGADHVARLRPAGGCGAPAPAPAQAAS